MVSLDYKTREGSTHILIFFQTVFYTAMRKHFHTINLIFFDIYPFDTNNFN